MKNVKKLIGKLALVLLLFVCAKVGLAQEQLVAVNATAVVSASAVNVVKPVVAVPESLAKAMVTGKVAGSKTSKEANERTIVNPKVQTLYWYERTGPNTYVLIGGGLTSAPTSLCPLTTGTNLCAVGFTEPQDEMNDAIAATSSYPRYKP